MPITFVIFLLMWIMGWCIAIGIVMGYEHTPWVRIGDLMVTLVSWPVFIGWNIGLILRAVESRTLRIKRSDLEDILNDKTIEKADEVTQPT